MDQHEVNPTPDGRSHDARLAELIASLEQADPAEAPALAASVADLLQQRLKG